jgi:hypothetical protein
MQKRANSAWADRGSLRFLIGLALAGSLAGGMTVGTKRTCYGEGTAKALTSNVRHGPKGTAAEYGTPVGRVRPTDRTHQTCRQI